jgi:hypothetical protein
MIPPTNPHPYQWIGSINEFNLESQHSNHSFSVPDGDDEMS